MPGAIVWFLTVGVLLCFSTTRFYGVLLGALFIYAYPLAALMVFITALGAGYLIHKWRVIMDSYIMDALNEVLEWDLPDEVIGEAVLLAVEGRSYHVES